MLFGRATSYCCCVLFLFGEVYLDATRTEAIARGNREEPDQKRRERTRLVQRLLLQAALAQRQRHEQRHDDAHADIGLVSHRAMRHDIFLIPNWRHQNRMICCLNFGQLADDLIYAVDWSIGTYFTNRNMAKISCVPGHLHDLVSS